MQTTKFFLVIGAVTLLAAVSILRGAESEAQKKAREALRQKWMELDGQSPTSRPPATAPVAPPPAAPPPRAVAPATPPPAAPVAAPRRTDGDARSKALEALRQQYQVDQAQLPGAPATDTAYSAIAAWTPGAADNPAQAKAREALWQKWRELDSQQPVAPPIGTPSDAGFPSMAFKPTEPPPSAFSASKAGRLAELLRQYRADQITPEHYHKQRAAILAEK
jgi:hypothetical protein